jgi:acyl carrier protein
MKIDQFAEQFADAIEVSRESIDAGTEFKKLEVWDSLCVLTIIAMVDTNYSITVGGNDLETASTVGDLYEIVKSRVK